MTERHAEDQREQPGVADHGDDGLADPAGDGSAATSPESGNRPKDEAGHADTMKKDQYLPHHANAKEAPNGEGTVSPHSILGERDASGHRHRPEATLDHPIMDGSTEDYSPEGRELNPRFGKDDQGLIRHAETGETTPTPEGY